MIGLTADARFVVSAARSSRTISISGALLALSRCPAVCNGTIAVCQGTIATSVVVSAAIIPLVDVTRGCRRWVRCNGRRNSSCLSDSGDDLRGLSVCECSSHCQGRRCHWSRSAVISCQQLPLRCHPNWTYVVRVRIVPLVTVVVTFFVVFGVMVTVEVFSMQAQT